MERHIGDIVRSFYNSKRLFTWLWACLTKRKAIQAVQALKRGACDYLAKPCPVDDLMAKAKKAASRKKKREAQILEIRSMPYLSKRERDERISKVLDG